MFEGSAQSTRTVNLVGVDNLIKGANQSTLRKGRREEIQPQRHFPLVNLVNVLVNTMQKVTHIFLHFPGLSPKKEY